MSKLFKNSKQILALVFAFAILAVSLFAGSITASACDVSKVDYWDGTLASSFAGGSGVAGDPFIIETAEQLALVCLGQEPSTSSNVYYKVADSVKIFVMQPESVVDIDELMALDSPDAVANYFAGLEGKLNWMSKFNSKSFNGNFDGNGATVYGLYAVGIAAKADNDDVGLFPQYDGGTVVGSTLITNTCKNIAVKNSYFSSRRRMGAIAGASYLSGYGAKIDGKLTVDSCAVVNCYMTSVGSLNYFKEQGVVVGGGAGDIMELKNILVKDVYAYNTEQKANINIIGNGSSRKVANKYVNSVSNSIFLGTAPYGAGCFSDTVHEPYVYTNVVTDMPSGIVDMPTPTWASPTTQRDFTDHIFSITETGVAFKAAANMLDWKNTWFMGENGPELRVFHSGLKLNATTTTHVWECDCCGAQSAGGITEHTFVLFGDAVKGDGTDIYMCSECEYVCSHGEQTLPEFDEGDCVTASGVYARCKICEWYIVTDVGGISGHNLTHVPADIGDCKIEGHKEYWHCSVCDNKFTSDNNMAPMNTAVSDEELSTGFGPHVKAEDENGVIILYDENGHWYTCAVQGGRLDHDSNYIGEDGVIKHKFKNAKCVDCGYQCTNHDYQPTGTLIVLHSCENDEVSELKCTHCGFTASAVTKEACHTIVKVDHVDPNDKKEGSKEHYKCEACNAVFADAEGKQPITRAELVIRKQLPAEYDNSYKSPATGDNMASVIVLTALAGATLVIARKVKR